MRTPGSGRKPTLHAPDPYPLSFRPSLEIVEWLDQQPPGDRSKLIREAIEDFIRRSQEQPQRVASSQ